MFRFQLLHQERIHLKAMPCLNMHSGQSVAHDKGIRAPKHFRAWQILQGLRLLCSRHSSIQAQHPHDILLFCCWLQVYGSPAGIHCDCLASLPGTAGNMESAAPTQPELSKLHQPLNGFRSWPTTKHPTVTNLCWPCLLHASLFA